MPIKVRNLKYIYNQSMPGETTALNDVSLDIADGEVIGIIGHTGSGKSTLLQHLNGILKPTEGTIYIDDVCITEGNTKLSEIRKKVGLVFQYPEYQLFEDTVAKDVAFGPKNLGLNEEEVDYRVKESIRLVGLDYEKIKDHSPFDLSGGMKRRVAIAGVIAMKPNVLILDEPTAGLDPFAHKEILAMIRRIHDNMGIIIIFVSHHMGDIASMSDKVVVMNKGKIEIEGSPHSVFSKVNELKKMGLDIPPIMRIMKEISKEIPEIDPNVLNIEEACEEIKRYQTLSNKS